ALPRRLRRAHDGELFFADALGFVRIFERRALALKLRAKRTDLRFGLEMSRANFAERLLRFGELRALGLCGSGALRVASGLQSGLEIGTKLGRNGVCRALLGPDFDEFGIGRLSL